MTDYIANSVGSNSVKFPSTFTKGDRLTINTTGAGQVGYPVQWTVPADGKYRLIASGAEGGDIDKNRSANVCPPGKGAIMAGDFTLNKGEIINIVIGQKPNHTPYNGSAGGGGGHDTGWGAGGSATTSSNDVSGARGNGGSKGVGQGGNGGSISGGSSGHSGGGGTGWFSQGNNGQMSTTNNIGYGGTRFNGGYGAKECLGGFGGGGAGGNGVAGGGGSYNIGENQTSSAAIRSGNGIVVIEYIGNPRDILMLVQDGDVVKTYQDSMWKVI
ncbi:hypothetical protein [Bacillus mobilis]|uniref:hypothetical protein n=1 Tax=Bacillus mobilis TaxID=2026190 RepID=UPI0036B294D2